MCTPLDYIATPQPYLIPGYTGYCPQYLYRAGYTYGSCSHKLLVDPSIQHSEKLILSDRTVDDYQVYRPSQKDIDVLKTRTRCGNSVYQHPMIPVYEGFVPRLNNHFGQRYTVQATEAISDFEQMQQKNRSAGRHLKILGAAQDDDWDPKSLQDKTLIKTEYKLPLFSVRPEQVGIIRDRKVVEPSVQPPIHSLSPYFMNNDNPGKRIKQGATIHVPFGYSRFGQSNDPMTNSAICDFTSNYRKRQSTEWAPVNLSRPDPPLHIAPLDIYHKHLGMVPSYTGHVPGARFRCGRTFGEDSRDAKRWLRRDFRLDRKKPLKIDTIIQDSFRRKQAYKSRFSGREFYGYTHGLGEQEPRTDTWTNEFSSTYRQRCAAEWQPKQSAQHPCPTEIMCYEIYHNHVGLIPNYGGFIPGAKFRFGSTFGKDTTNLKRWFRGDFRPN